MTLLRTLRPTAHNELTTGFLDGTSDIDVVRHVDDYPRDVDLAPLKRVVEEAMKRFSADKPEDSDAWLAPRVHATLRLTRREAADRQVWAYLGIVECREYVRWRWGTPTALTRYTGSEVNQALSRLWWGAELTRDGPGYEPVEQAFEFQDIPNTWFRLDAFHNRAAALAALRVISRLTGGQLPNGKAVKRTKKINMLSTAFNIALTTTVLDSVAPSEGADAGALSEWIKQEPDETLMLDELPDGPPEENVDDEQIKAVELLIQRVAEGAGLFHAEEEAASDDETERDGDEGEGEELESAAGVDAE